MSLSGSLWPWSGGPCGFGLLRAPPPWLVSVPALARPASVRLDIPPLPAPPTPPGPRGAGLRPERGTDSSAFSPPLPPAQDGMPRRRPSALSGRKYGLSPGARECRRSGEEESSWLGPRMARPAPQDGVGGPPGWWQKHSPLSSVLPVLGTTRCPGRQLPAGDVGARSRTWAGRGVTPPRPLTPGPARGGAQATAPLTRRVDGSQFREHPVQRESHPEPPGGRPRPQNCPTGARDPTEEGTARVWACRGATGTAAGATGGPLLRRGCHRREPQLFPRRPSWEPCPKQIL